MGNLLKSFWFNVLLILVICFGIYFVFVGSLSRITRHGEEVLVPKVLNTQAGSSIDELTKLGFDIQVDSVYDTLYQPLMILDVQPDGGSLVKKGRTIYLKINKVNPPELSMPNLLNLSLRSAVLLLNTSNLIMGDTTYKPDMAEGAVLQMLYNGQPISAGTKIFQGSKIDLVVGSGYGQTNIQVPDLINIPYLEAIQILQTMNLFYTEVWDGRISDTATAVVYFQFPTSKNEQGYPNHILEGENMDIRIRQEPLVIDSVGLGLISSDPDPEASTSNHDSIKNKKNEHSEKRDAKKLGNN
ncbi:MAG TPA: hypothetical protein PKX92_06960 [Edaphocola sp.]|nr:hypothetical protein [Edaphocola sp.]